MYEGLSLEELPEEAFLIHCKVRVPEDVLLHDDKTKCEGYLFMQPKFRTIYKWPELGLGARDIPDGEFWFLTPEPFPRKRGFTKYELDLTKCNPEKDIIVVAYDK